MTSPEENFARYQKNRNLRYLLVVLGLLAIYGIGSIGSNSSETTQSSSQSNAAINQALDTSWIPSDYTYWPDDPEVAWRWAKASEVSCTYDSASCWGIMVIAKNGCKNSLYGEISIFDKSDIQIGYTNDTLSSVQPMQKSKMIFDSFDDEASSASVSKISCY